MTTSNQVGTVADHSLCVPRRTPRGSVIAATERTDSSWVPLAATSPRTPGSCVGAAALIVDSLPSIDGIWRAPQARASQTAHDPYLVCATLLRVLADRGSPRGRRRPSPAGDRTERLRDEYWRAGPVRHPRCRTHQAMFPKDVTARDRLLRRLRVKPTRAPPEQSRVERHQYVAEFGVFC